MAAGQTSAGGGGGAIQYVLAGSGSLKASEIAFTSTSSAITATNVQDAFTQLFEAFGM